MTRINLVPPRELSNQHLMAEYRELPRVFTAILKRKNPISPEEIPESFRLGKGHVKFFYNKLRFLQRRYYGLYAELRLRKYNIRLYSPYIEKELFPDWQWNDWSPEHLDIQVSRTRLKDKIRQKPLWYRWTLNLPPTYARELRNEAIKNNYDE